MQAASRGDLGLGFFVIPLMRHTSAAAALSLTLKRASV